MKVKNKIQIVITIVILFICVVVASTLIWMELTSPRPSPPITPTLFFTTEKDENNYILYINSCYDSKRLLTLEKVEVAVYNKSNLVVGHVIVVDILDDESSNITFYDNDNNDRLSVGDEFIIDCDIVTPGANFVGVYRPYGETAFKEILY